MHASHPSPRCSRSCSWAKACASCPSLAACMSPSSNLSQPRPPIRLHARGPTPVSRITTTVTSQLANGKREEKKTPLFPKCLYDGMCVCVVKSCSHKPQPPSHSQSPTHPRPPLYVANLVVRFQVSHSQIGFARLTKHQKREAPLYGLFFPFRQSRPPTRTSGW
ncbi:hypothetical protein B0T22DRAFT_260711 [Podospora appendiculata]|uniref:Uncharacterized protein n=1 Tax=Podospora appendiculata TaxID=314037 RepID=A0AAE1C936_9PEZI|nr:hypothetical protein B0T22DRAFT_260711 [Podospora appendiculata]